MNCSVYLHTVTTEPGVEPLCYDFGAPGNLQPRKNGGYEIVYNDVSPEGEEFLNTIVSADDGTVSVSRKGRTKTEFTLELEKKHICMVSTPIGNIALGVQTHNITDELSPKGGSLFFSYSLDANNQHLTDNSVKLTVINNDTL
jgi:uncharacterized beta-barrel protein YwiB (DUF1934 family)